MCSNLALFQLKLCSNEHSTNDRKLKRSSTRVKYLRSSAGDNN